MRIKKNLFNGSQTMGLKNTRRYFFKFVGLFSYMVVMPTFLQSKEDESIKDKELFLVDGWVLKKSDIHDL